MQARGLIVGWTPPVLNSHAIQKGTKWSWEAWQSGTICHFEALPWSLVTWLDSSIPDANSNAHCKCCLFPHVAFTQTSHGTLPWLLLETGDFFQVWCALWGWQEMQQVMFLMFCEKLRLITRLHCLYLDRTAGFSVLPIDYCQRACVIVYGHWLLWNL